jgi:hypothetical protein
VGNAGGGAPLLNTNAQIHGAFSDLRLLDERLSPPERASVDALTASLQNRLGTEPAVAREFALRLYAAGLAEEDVATRGLVLDAEGAVPRINPTLDRARLLTRRVVRALDAAQEG